MSIQHQLTSLLIKVTNSLGNLSAVQSDADHHKHIMHTDYRQIETWNFDNYE